MNVIITVRRDNGVYSHLELKHEINKLMGKINETVVILFKRTSILQIRGVGMHWWVGFVWRVNHITTLVTDGRATPLLERSGRLRRGSQRERASS